MNNPDNNKNCWSADRYDFEGHSSLMKSYEEPSFDELVREYCAKCQYFCIDLFWACEAHLCVVNPSGPIGDSEGQPVCPEFKLKQKRNPRKPS